MSNTDMSSNITEWFGLKEKRTSFILDPQGDADFYAPRTGVDIPTLEESIQVDLVTDRAPKRLFWGRYGGGKTHTLFHISKRLLQKHLKIHPIYIECPSVPKNSTFIHLYHDGIMASMGQDFILEIFKDLIGSLGIVRFEELFAKLKGILEDEELSRAVSSLLGARPEKELTFWRYISGVSVPTRDLAELNLTESLVDAIPSRLAYIVIIVGRVVKKTKGETLVLVLDELDRLRSVTDAFGASTYEEAFRKFVDENQRDVSIIMGCSAMNTRDLPDMFAEEGGPIISRIGKHNIIEISEIQPNDVDNFIIKILEYVVDKKIAEQKMKKFKEESLNEIIKIELFPFTKEAIEALKGVLTGYMTPREITQRMSDAIGKAFLLKRPVVTSDIIGG